MKLLSLTSALLGIAGVVAGISIDEVTDDVPSLVADTAPGRYIVQLETKEKLSDPVQSFSDIGYRILLQHSYDSPVFEGLSFEVKNNNETTLDDIKQIDGVKDAWEASTITLIFDPKEVNEPAWDTHSLTGVDKLHDKGEFGEDIVIGVIDTGVDYNHPVFNGGLGHGSIIGGYDFFVDDVNKPGSDPMDCIGHGTFVSSLIAGNSETIVGVAPGAKIRMYKVFGCEQDTSDDYILAGMLKAFNEGVDILSLSLGSDAGYSSAPLSLVAAEIAKSIPVIFSAGNSGSYGPFRSSSGASGEGVISVGSVEADSLVGWPAIAKSSSGEEFKFNYVAEKRRFIANGSYEVQWTDNICFYSGWALGPKRLLMGNRGLCFNEFASNYIEQGNFPAALAVSDDLFYAQFKLPSWLNLKDIGLVNTTIGYWVRDQISAGNTVKIDFNPASLPVEEHNPRVTAGQINRFSSWGPTFSNSFYPTLSAPGGNVLGARRGGGYFITSGTSLSCPYIAGVVALYLKSNPGASPEMIKSKLVGATNLLSEFKERRTDEKDFSLVDSSSRAPLIQQGAGLIDAFAMLEKKITVNSSPYLELNDTDNRVTHFEISFTNEDSSEVNFQIGHSPLKAVDTRDPDYYVASYYPPLRDASASVSISQDKITVGPGQKATFTVEINPPQTDEGPAPIFQGTIDITGSNGDSVRVPYMGLGASMYNWTPLGDPLVIRYDRAAKKAVSLKDSMDYYFDPSRYDSPRVYYVVRFGTELYSFDIVDSDYDVKSYKFPLVAGEDGYQGPLMATPDPRLRNATFPVSYTPRLDHLVMVQFQGFANGTKIPSGRYKIMARALRMFGDKNKPEDWQIFLSDEMNVAYKGELPGQSSSAVESSTISESAPPGQSSSSAESSSEIQFSSVETSAKGSSSSVGFESSASLPSSTVSSSSTQSSSSTDNTALPTASAYKNNATPTGVDIITKIEAKDSVSGRQMAYKGNIITVAVSVEVKEKLAAGTTTQFTMPGIFYDDMSARRPIRLSTKMGRQVATLVNDQDSNIWTITFDTDYVEEFDYFSGTFTFNVRMQYTDEVLSKRDATETVDLSKPVVIPVVFTTPSQEFTSNLEFHPYPTDQPFKVFRNTDDGPIWDVYVPGSIGAWSSVSFESNRQTYYAWNCAEMTGTVGNKKDAFGLPISGTKSPAWFMTCRADGLSGTLASTIPTDDIFKFHLVGRIPEDNYMFLLQITVAFPDRARKTYSLYDDVPGYIVGDGSYYVFPDESIRPSEIGSSQEISSTEVVSSDVATESSVVGSSSSANSDDSSAEASSAEASSAEASSAEASSAETSSAAAESLIETSSSYVTSSVLESSAESDTGSSADKAPAETSSIDLISSPESSTRPSELSSNTEYSGSSVVEFSESSNVSEATVSVTSATSTDSTLPTLSEHRNSILPTGLDVITNIDILDRQPNADVFTISVSVESAASIDNDITQFTIPGIFYDFLNSFELQSTEGEYVGRVTGDESTNLFTVTFDSEWAKTHKNIRGTFTFDVRLSYSLRALKRRALDTVALTGQSVIPVVFVAPGDEFASSLTMNPSIAEAPASGRNVKTNVFEGDMLVGSAASVSATNADYNADSIVSGATSGTNEASAETLTYCSQGRCSVSPSAEAPQGTESATGVVTNTESIMVTVTSCSQGICSDVLSTVEPTTRPQTTVVTVTSCSDNKCTTEETTALLSTATTTVNGVETVYTTYCETENARESKQTVTLTVTSCSNKVCVTSESMAILSSVTATVNGHEMVHTTYVPVSTAVDKSSGVEQASPTGTARSGEGEIEDEVTKKFGTRSAQPFVAATEISLHSAATEASTVAVGSTDAASHSVVTDSSNSGMSLITNPLVFFLSFFAVLA